MSNNKSIRHANQLKNLFNHARGHSNLPARKAQPIGHTSYGEYGVPCGSIEKIDRVIKERGKPIAFEPRHATAGGHGSKVVLIYKKG